MGILYGLVVAIIWGAQPVVATFGYRASLTILDLTLLRFTVSGLVMLPLFLRRGVWNAGGTGWPRALVLLLLAGPLYNMVLVGGLHWAPASHSSLIYPAFTPLFTSILARLMLGRQDRIPLFGLGLLVLGVLVVKIGSVLQAPAQVYADAWRGDLLFMLAALMWSFYTVLMRRWNTDPLSVVSVIQVGALLYVPVYFLFEGGALFDKDLVAIAVQAGYQGLLVSVVSVLLFNLAVKQMGAKASMFTALMPLVGVSLAIVVLGEAMSLSLLAGALLISGGLFLSLRTTTSKQ
ncbi:DMT family transporter [Undibacterium sp. CY18W]|uniref:DMT family transporter n=1 Tax=Undibacterium hunanense TaxID=2762292 RepID=A0ABR6ZUZ3_9BURK|nr:DMT family transporter [Undibacterium hunanense]MBC3919335.1 DMT family transporter [Undibacterium hunanense]